MVWKQPRPEILKTARSESSRDQKTQKLHGLKAAETKKIRKFITLQNLKLEIKLKVKSDPSGIKTKIAGEGV